MIQVQTIDESTTGASTLGPMLILPSADISIRELIEFRVRNEVDRYNRERPEYFEGLVQPTELEQALNGKSRRRFKPIDVERQISVAIEAFQKQRVIVLTPKGQAGALEETVSLYDGDQISFLRLVPLVGG